MTEEQRLSDAINLGHRVRARIENIIHELDDIPEQLGPLGSAHTSWRVGLLTLVWDVSDAALTLATARAKQLRAMRILTRSLYEYAIHLEFYAYEPIQGIRDWLNSQAWLKGIAKGAIDAEDLCKWTKDERRAYYEMIRADGKFEYQDFNRMLRRVFEGRGYTRKEVRKSARLGANFYAISSSFVHGSQGSFYDLFEQVSDHGPWRLNLRSFRLKEIQLVHEVVFYIILALFAESIHRKRDLGADIYWRELDLIVEN